MKAHLSLLALLLMACTPDQLGPDPTPALPLDEQVEVDRIMAHLAALEQLADDNGGNRAMGSPGYDASVVYIQTELESLGYDVEVEELAQEQWGVDSASLAQTSPVSEAYALDLDDEGTGFHVLAYSPSGTVNGTLELVDLFLPPGSPNDSTSGCQAADFSAFPSGAIALVQRGSCTFAAKAANAEAAGALAVIIFNEGQAGRTAPVEGVLDESNPPGIPVVGIGFALGQALVDANGFDAVSMSLDVQTSVSGLPLYNVMASVPGQPVDDTVMVGGHLDSVAQGPGVNDNGSGSALILELARVAIQSDRTVSRGLRFAFWDGEEKGLWGSGAFIDDRSANAPGELDAMAAYLNFDMVGSSNGLPFVYDGDGTAQDWYSTDAHPGSDSIEALFRAWYSDKGYANEEVGLYMPSDSANFLLADIPNGGVYTGADEVLSANAVQVYGGVAGEPMDACYHRACDRLDQINVDLLEQTAQAAAAVLEEIAFDGVGL